MALPEAVVRTESTDDAEMSVAGVPLVADVSGALWWPAEETLIVADLHLEKGSAFARRGAFLPPYDSRSTLARLRDVMDRRNPAQVIALGDSFHDVAGTERLPAAERRTLAELQRGRTWIWITGNHDPSIGAHLGGEVREHLVLNGLTFRHEPQAGPTVGEVAGHLHPSARIVSHGRSIRARCFIGDGHRLVVPAFGAFTGGLNVCDPAFDELFQPDRACLSIWMIGKDGVYPINSTRLRGD